MLYARTASDGEPEPLPRTARVDHEGRFEFVGVPPGTHQLVVLGGSDLPEILQAPITATRTESVVAMSEQDRGRLVTAVVRDSEGRPVASLPMRITQPVESLDWVRAAAAEQFEREGRRPRLLNRSKWVFGVDTAALITVATTDGDGRFEFRMYEGFGITVRAAPADRKQVLVHRGGFTSIPGDEVSLELPTVFADARFALSGMSNAQPVDVHIVRLDRSAPSRRVTWRSPGERVVRNLPAGEYLAELRTEDGALGGTVEFDLPRDRDSEARVAMAPTGSLRILLGAEEDSGREVWVERRFRQVLVESYGPLRATQSSVLVLGIPAGDWSVAVWEGGSATSAAESTPVRIRSGAQADHQLKR